MGFRKLKYAYLSLNIRVRTIKEVLVQWKGCPIEDASWEDWDALIT